MWRRYYRKADRLSYRKKYYCPDCQKYTVCALSDELIVCENGCYAYDNILDVLMDHDFERYYTRDEVYSIISRENAQKMHDDVVFEIEDIDIYPRKTRESIMNLFEKSVGFDEMIDDMVVGYLNYSNLREAEGEVIPFAFLINLVEDAHQYINQCCKDSVLFAIALKIKESDKRFRKPFHKMFYPARFFYQNIADHMFQALDRSFTILGMQYGFPFSKDMKKNKASDIERYLKTISAYKEKGYHDVYTKLKGNKGYRALKDLRDSSNHNLSAVGGLVREEVEKNNLVEKYDRHGSDIDRELFIPKMINAISCLEILYDFMEILLNDICYTERCYTLSENPLYERMKNNTINYPSPSKLHTYISLIEIVKNSDKIYEKFKKHLQPNGEPAMLLADIFFRLREIQICVSDSFKICSYHDDYFGGNEFFEIWNKEGYDLRGLITEQDLLYNAMILMYACYDKLARYMKTQFELCDNVKYFDDFKNIEHRGVKIIRKAKRISKSFSYVGLSDFRNGVYHTMRMGILYGDDSIDYNNQVLFCILMDNLTTFSGFYKDVIDGTI